MVPDVATGSGKPGTPGGARRRGGLRRLISSVCLRTHVPFVFLHKSQKVRRLEPGEEDTSVRRVCGDREARPDPSRGGQPRGRTLGEPTPPPAADGAPRRPPDGSAAACHACPSVPHALRTERPSRGGARAGPGLLAAVGPRSRAGGVLRTALIRTVGTLVCSGSRGRLSRSPGSPKTDGGLDAPRLPATPTRVPGTFSAAAK